MNEPAQTMRFRSVFTAPHVVLPVIHVVSTDQALRNAGIAREAGSDGVFLINHGIDSGSLLRIHQEVAAAFPNWWIGVNCLDLQPEQVLSCVSQTVSGIWTDNALIDENRTSQPAAERVVQAQKQANWRGLYFGGVAFKYQREVDDLARAAGMAMQYMDVVTTSGPGTGHAADVDKIRVMKEALGKFPLAIASGITPENVEDYLPHADCFLVATGISTSFEELDPARARVLVDTVKSYEDQTSR